MKLGLAALTASLVLCLPALAGVSAGAPAPQFTLPKRGGGHLSLAQLKGKVVLINFWASWCDPCRREMPLLESLYKRYSKLGFTLIGVNVDPNREAADRWLKQAPVTFPILYDTRSKVSNLYQVSGMPSTVIIDRKGTVRFLHRSYRPGDESLYADTIRSLLTE